MRFMMLMIPKGYESAEPGTLPDPEGIERMMAYNKELQEAGVLLALDGLHPPSMGARVSFEGGTPSVTDGKSKAEAIEWAKRCPGSENEVIEIRQVQEMSDFPEDVKEAVARLEGMGGAGEAS